MKISNLAAAAIYTLFSSKLVNGRLKIGNNELNEQGRLLQECPEGQIKDYYYQYCIKCPYPETVYTDGKCICAQGLIGQGYNNGWIDCESCGSNSYASESIPGTCICEEGYVWDNSIDECNDCPSGTRFVPELLDGRNQGYCDCEVDYVRNDEYDTCEPCEWPYVYSLGSCVCDTANNAFINPRTGDCDSCEYYYGYEYTFDWTLLTCACDAENYFFTNPETGDCDYCPFPEKEFVNGECMCSSKRFFFTDSNGECYKCEPPTMEMDNGECVCASGLGYAPGSGPCVCQDGYVEVPNKGCMPCPETETIFENGSCVCTEGDGYVFDLGSFSCKKNTKRCWEECIADGGMTANDCKALIRSEISVSHEIPDLKVTIRKPRDEKTFQDSYWYIGIPTNLSGFTSCYVNDAIVRYPFDWTVSTPNGGTKVVSIPQVDCKGLRASQCCTKIMDTMAAEGIPTTDSNGHCLTCWVHSVPLEPVIHPSQGLMYKDYSHVNGVCRESLLAPAAVQNADKKAKDRLLQLGTYLENYAYNREAFMPMACRELWFWHDELLMSTRDVLSTRSVVADLRCRSICPVRYNDDTLDVLPKDLAADFLFIADEFRKSVVKNDVNYIVIYTDKDSHVIEPPQIGGSLHDIDWSLNDECGE